LSIERLLKNPGPGISHTDSQNQNFKPAREASVLHGTSRKKTTASFRKFLELRATGINAIPAKSQSKEPALGWIQHRYRPLSFQKAEQFCKEDSNLLAVCGSRGVDGWYLNELDCDTREAVAAAKAWLAKHGIKTLEFTSESNPKPQNRLKVWFKTDKPVITSRKDFPFEIRTRHCLTAVPSNIHPKTKQPYRICSEADLFRIARLTTNHPAIQELGLVPTEDRDDMGQAVYTILKGSARIVGKGNKKTPGEYESRSEAEYTAVLLLLEKNWSETAIRDLFENHAGDNTHFKGMKNSTAANRWLTNCFIKAKRWIQEDKSTFKQKIRKIREDLNKLCWAYSGGRTDYLVINAHLDRMKRCHRDEYLASLTDIGVILGFSRDKVLRSQRRLMALGYIVPVRNHTFRLSTVWKVSHSWISLCAQDQGFLSNILDVEHTREIRDRLKVNNSLYKIGSVDTYKISLVSRVIAKQTRIANFTACNTWFIPQLERMCCDQADDVNGTNWYSSLKGLLKSGLFFSRSGFTRLYIYALGCKLSAAGKCLSFKVAHGLLGVCKSTYDRVVAWLKFAGLTCKDTDNIEATAGNFGVTRMFELIVARLESHRSLRRA